MALSIVAIGNPGAGKSTILNGIAGEILFKSGISIGDGLTYQLDEKENSRAKFLDTPGLADNARREEAGKAISNALRKGGNYKVLFFVMTQAGRVSCQDITTLKLVLEAAPEVQNQYGIIINKLPKNVANLLQAPQHLSEFISKLFTGIEEGKRCDKSNIVFLQYNPELDGTENKLIAAKNIETLEGSSFEDFIFLQMPTVNLTTNRAGDIDVHDFEQTSKELENLTIKMNEDKLKFMEDQKALQEQLQKAEEEKLEEQKRAQEIHNQEMKILEQKAIEKQREEEAARAEAERQAKLQQEKVRLQLEEQARQHQIQIQQIQAQQQNSRRRRRRWYKI